MRYHIKQVLVLVDLRLDVTQAVQIDMEPSVDVRLCARTMYDMQLLCHCAFNLFLRMACKQGFYAFDLIVVGAQEHATIRMQHV